VPYFAITGGFHAKFLRYMLPIVPSLCLLGAAGLVALSRWRPGSLWPRRLALGAAGLVVALSALYAVAYATAGALASRQQNADTAGQPVTYTLLAVYFGGYVALTSDTDGLLANLLTVFPLSAPLVLPARSALVGVPLDLGVTMRSGTRMGPREIRNQSRLLGVYNHALRMTPFADFRVADVGDVPFQTTFNLEEAHRDIEAFYRKLASAGARPVSAGGDHSITFPILKAVAAQEKVGLVHFDTHCDTAEPYAGNGLNHGCPFRKAVKAGLVDPERTIQIGIRGGYEPLWDFSRESGMWVVHIEDFYELGWKRLAREIREMMGETPFYITFDVDCLDPAYAPGTGTPAAGGMTTFEALQTLRGLRGLNVVGGDVVEVAPPYDHSGITALAGATIMFEILCLVAESPGTARP
jgi:agmatinase